jgi:hypothetical protein
MAQHRPETLLAELNRLEALRDAKKPGQQRQFNRFAIRADAELHPVSRSRLDRTPIEVKLRDIGRGGMGFITQQPLPAGSGWRVAFLRHGYVVSHQAIFIRHCRPVSDGLYLIGAQFVVDTGTLAMLGVDPGAVLDGDEAADDDHANISFLPPGEVA